MLERPDGRRLPGKLTGDPRSGFRFDAAGAAAPIRLEPGSVVAFEGPGPDPTTAYPPFRLELGLGQRISGRLGSVGEAGARLLESSAGGTIVLARPGVHAVVQRLGEVQVFDDDFEAIDHHRWDQGGDPEIVDEPRLAKEHSLRIPAGVASLTCRLPEPIGSGRLEVAFHDTGVVAPASSGSSTSCSGTRTAPRPSGRSWAGPRRAWRSSRPAAPRWRSSGWRESRAGIA